jgi:hypothetical protein
VTASSASFLTIFLVAIWFAPNDCMCSVQIWRFFVSTWVSPLFQKQNLFLPPRPASKGTST